MTKLTDREYKVYVRSFARAIEQFACMKYYVKLCIQENDADHIILYVGPNELKYESRSERKAKSVVGVAKYLQTDTLSVSASPT